MNMSNFRRCVLDELVDEDEGNKISIVYSGQVALMVNNIADQLNRDQLNILEVGEEIGCKNYTNAVDYDYKN